jgi:small subunit ribosomal protein S8
MTDPISDMLTRIRNAQKMGHEALSLPASKLKQRIAKVLADEGYVRDVEFRAEGPQGVLSIGLKYGPDKTPVINEMKRVSRPGRRVYVGVEAIPRVKNGLGIAIISTSKGVVVDREARKNRLGGELLCTVW